MTYYIDIQRITQDPIPVADEQLKVWATLALKYTEQHDAELTIRLVDQDEIQQLNTTYRHQAKPTNVLSFPSSLPPHLDLDCPFLGDVIICPAVLKAESIHENKALDAHWALIVMHGVLHLLGYDHLEAQDTQVMQNIEITLLQQLGFPNPYHEDAHLE